MVKNNNVNETGFSSLLRYAAILWVGVVVHQWVLKDYRTAIPAKMMLVYRYIYLVRYRNYYTDNFSDKTREVDDKMCRRFSHCRLPEKR